MEIFDHDKRDILRPCNVRLVQSGHFVKEKLKKEIAGLDDIINLDFMGAFEFQSGIQYHSLKRIVLNSDFYHVYEFPNYHDEKGNTLKAYAPESFFWHIAKIVTRLAKDGHIYDEFCTLVWHIHDNEQKEKYADSSNFWWDLDNDFFMFFENADKIENAIAALKNKSFGFNAGIPKKSLSNLVIKSLSERGENSYLAEYLSIRNYYFDTDQETHYVEFRKGEKLERIIRDAMVMARADGGKVVFEVNGIAYKIDARTTIDEIIFGYVIDIDDICTESTEISTLLKRKKTEQSLLRVLNSISKKQGGM